MSDLQKNRLRSQHASAMKHPLHGARRWCRRHRRIPLLIWLLLLISCTSQQPTTPTPPSALVLPQTPTPRKVAVATAVSPGVGLPGRLLFAAAGNIWLWQGEGGRQLTNSGDAFQPAWAPDGNRVAYVRRSESASDLVELNLGDGATNALISYTPDQPLGSIERVYESMWVFYPAWSPDGAELAFASQFGPPYGEYASDYRLGLYTMPPEPGAERSRRYADESGHVGRMAYTPDGLAILYTLIPDAPGIPQIYRYDRTTDEVGALPGLPEQSYDPAVSPDGTQLAFAARHDGKTDIFVMPLAGGPPVQLTRIGAARAPAFSPDGTMLAFIAAAAGERGFDIWVLSLKPTGAAEPRRISFDLGLDADSGLSWGR